MKNKLLSDSIVYIISPIILIILLYAKDIISVPVTYIYLKMRKRTDYERWICTYI